MTEARPGAGEAIAVLGATGGIGSALVRRLAGRGVRVVLGARGREALERLAEEVGGVAVAVDGRDFEQVDRFVAAAAAGGALAGAVNCAGSVLLKPAHVTSRSDFDDTVATNLTTAFALVRSAVPHLRKRGGSIVLLSSAASEIGLANHEAIAAAKGGVAGLTRAAAASYAARGIRVNAVAPGLVATGATRRIVDNDRALQASVSLHPLGRIGDADDVAALIDWLLGSESGWMTGQVLQLDGGLASLKLAR